VSEFTAAGFLAPLEELDEGWVTGEYEHDFLPPLMLTGRSQGRTFAVTPRPTWPACGTGGPDSHPVVLPGGSKAGEAATDVLLALPASNGAAVLEDGLVALTARPPIEALQLLRELVVEGVVPVEAVALQWTGRSGCWPTARRPSASAAATRGPAWPRRPGCRCPGAGRDRRHRYQDANDLPTALAPLWGLCGPEDRQWSATMRFALDPGQPGPDRGAVGRPRLSPHPGTWDAGLGGPSGG
jgi:hypothetical protein